MKKLTLKSLGLSTHEVLTRAQLKNVIGGNGSDSSSDQCTHSCLADCDNEPDSDPAWCASYCLSYCSHM